MEIPGNVDRGELPLKAKTLYDEIDRYKNKRFIMRSVIHQGIFFRKVGRLVHGQKIGNHEEIVFVVRLGEHRLGQNIYSNIFIRLPSNNLSFIEDNEDDTDNEVNDSDEEDDNEENNNPDFNIKFGGKNITKSRKSTRKSRRKQSTRKQSTRKSRRKSTRKSTRKQSRKQSRRKKSTRK